MLRHITGALQKWRLERGRHISPGRSERSTMTPATTPPPQENGLVCERIVVFNKRDLVPEWGIEVCGGAPDMT